jgi:Na+/melibiose symporter-like transporter
VTTQTAEAPPLTTATKLWYALGQFAEGLKNEAYSLLLLFYYTQVLGLSGALAGQAILIALLFDAVTDPLIGTLSDRMRSRWGRRHPFLYAAPIPLGIFFTLSFTPPQDLSQLQLFGWLATMTVLTRASMTLFHVPHLALGAELSSDYEERTRIVTLAYLLTRLGHGAIGGFAFLWFFRPTPEFPGDRGRFNPEAYTELAFTFGVVMVICILLSAWRTHHRIPYLAVPNDEPRQRSLARTIFGDLIESLHHASFRALFFGLALTYIAWGVTTALGLHLGTYFWRASNEDLLVYGVAAALGILIGLPFWERRAVVLDKKPTFIWGLAIFTVSIVVPALCKLVGFWPGYDSPLQIGLWALISGGIAHFGLASTMVTGRSMMADVTDEDALAHGRRREGIFFGAVSFSSKASFGVGAMIAGFVVQAIGLLPNQAAEEVGPNVVQGLGVTLVVAILVLCGGSILVFSRYKLTRERHAEIQHALAARAAEA